MSPLVWENLEFGIANEGKKTGFGRGLAEVSWDVRFWANNRGELVTFFKKRLVFGLKMGVVTERLDTRFLGLRGKNGVSSVLVSS